MAFTLVSGRTMRTSWLLAFLATVLTPACAHALCMPGFDRSVSTEYWQSEYVMTVQVVAERLVPNPDDAEAGGYLATLYTVQPLKLIKGRRSGPLVLVSENNSGRFLMEVGQSYLVFIGRNPGEEDLWVSNCGSSTEMAKAGPVLQRLKAVSHRRRR